MKNTSTLVVVAMSILLLASCTVEKRRYMSGYHIDRVGKAPHSEKMASTTPDAEQVPMESALAAADEPRTVEASTDEVTAPAPVATTAAPAPAAEMPSDPVQPEVKQKDTGVPATIHLRQLLKAPVATGQAAGLAEAKQGADDMLILLVILALLLPPLAVYLKEGSWNTRCWISLLLTLFFWIPGVIFALLVVFDAI